MTPNRSRCLSKKVENEAQYSWNKTEKSIEPRKRMLSFSQPLYEGCILRNGAQREAEQDGESGAVLKC